MALPALWRRPGLIVYASLFASALAARLLMVTARPYGDEALHYFISRGLGTGAGHVQSIYPLLPWQSGACFVCPELFFWQRPAFSFLLWPGALVSFTGYRILHAAFTATLAPLAAVLVRQRGASLVAASVAGLTIALHPFFVTWGALAMPDSMALVALAAGLVARGQGRWKVMAMAFVVAAWTKEIMIVPLAMIAVFHVFRSFRARRITLDPFAMPTRDAFVLLSLALAPVPLLASLSMGAFFPGWARGGSLVPVLVHVWLYPWFLLLLLGGLALARTRGLSGLALGLGLFSISYRVALERSVQAWYLVPSAFLAVVAGALVLDEVGTRFSERRPRWIPRPWAVLLLAALVAFQTFVPAGSADKRFATLPFSSQEEGSLFEAVAFERARDLDQWRMFERTRRNDSLFLIDISPAFALYPLANHHASIFMGFTLSAEQMMQAIEPFQQHIENESATILGQTSTPLAKAILRTYEDCITAREGAWVLLGPGQCQGRLEMLQAAYADERALFR